MIDRLWLMAFVLTVAAEVPLVAAVAPRERQCDAARVAVAAQLFTHPLAWLAVTTGHVGWWIVEAGVVLVEAAIYTLAAGRPMRALGVALFANALSAGAGRLLLP
jgi:hypothetical protein